MKNMKEQTSRFQFIAVGVKDPGLLDMLHKTGFDVVEVGEENCCSRDVLGKEIPVSNMAILLVNTSHMGSIKTAAIAADICKERSELVIGFFTANDMRDTDIAALKDQMDALVLVSSNVHSQSDPMQHTAEACDTPLFAAAETILCFIRDVENTDTNCLDFSDVSSIFKNAGLAYMGISCATGHLRAENVAKEVLSNLTMKAPIGSAHKALVHITGSTDIDLAEIETIATFVQQALHPDASLVLGTALDEALGNEIRLSVIITDLIDGDQ